MHDYKKYNDELVDLIYKIPLNENGWTIFAQRLSHILNASAIHIVGIDFNYQAFSYSRAITALSEEETASIEVNYLHHYMKDDPRWQGFLTEKNQGWYQCHEHFTDQEIEQSDLYQNILVPSNIRYSSVHELIWDNQICVIMGVNTSKERGPLNQTDLDFLDEIIIHVKRVAAIQRHIFEFSAKAITGYALIDKLSQPIILISLSGQVIHSNTSAKKLLAENSTIQVNAEQLQLPEPYQLQLKENLQNIEFLFKSHKLSINSFMDDGCIQITDSKGDQLFIFASLLISEHEMRAFGTRPSVMLTLYHPHYSPKVNSHLLNSAFKLTPAESKVALLLLEGFLPKEIAQKNKVNQDTVRKQLQSIFKKTSTSRQSELVKLLLNMPRYIAEL